MTFPGPWRHRTQRRAALLALPLAGLLALAGCSGSSSEDAGGSAAGLDQAQPGGGPEAAVQEPGSGAAAEEQQAAPDAEDGAGAGEGASDAEGESEARQADSPALQASHLIRTANLVVATDQVPERYRQAVRLAASAGGFVSAETTERGADGAQVSFVTLRVPADRYEEVLTGLSELGEVMHREVTTEDVTDQVVDVESRIATQRESIERVRALLGEAESIGDIITLESELSTRQADLESLESRSESLRGRTAMATVHVELREPAPEREEPKEEDSSGPSVPGALKGGWDAFTGALLWTAAVLSAVLPFAGLAALLLALWRLVRGRWPWQRPPAPTPPSPFPDREPVNG